MNPPNMEELPECWYVVDRGYEVGIFANGYVPPPVVSLSMPLNTRAADVPSLPWLVLLAATKSGFRVGLRLWLSIMSSTVRTKLSA